MLTGDDSLRMNATITMVQRENTWHPYYEVKVEEEDIRSHFKSRAETQNARAGQTEINDIEKKIKELQDTQVIQETRKNNPDEPVPAVSNKRSWNPEQLKRDLDISIAIAATVFFLFILMPHNAYPNPDRRSLIDNLSSECRF